MTHARYTCMCVYINISSVHIAKRRNDPFSVSVISFISRANGWVIRVVREVSNVCKRDGEKGRKGERERER